MKAEWPRPGTAGTTDDLCHICGELLGWFARLMGQVTCSTKCWKVLLEEL